MPRFSVIVPVYQAQAFLPACLDSVLQQSCGDLELLAVDDCSPDSCGTLLEECAARDPRVRVLRHSANQGPGPARNTGLAHAGGDYVVFLDADDTLVPGALGAIADRLKETSEPDVLVYGHLRVDWWATAVRDEDTGLLTEAGPAPFRPSDRPGLLSAPAFVWNKAFSREFIEREGFRFPTGHYEDIPWTYPVLMAAETIATLDRSCVQHRRRRQGSVLGTTSLQHFDILHQYERLFAYVDARPELRQWRPPLYRRMADDFSAVFTGDRLPRGSRAEFLRRARAACLLHRAPGAPVQPRTRLRHAMVRLGAHRTYRTLCAALRLRGRLTRSLRAALRHTRTTALRAHYGLQRRLPLRADLAVFTSAGGYDGDPGALESAFRDLAPHIRTAWIADDRHHHTVPTATRRLRPGTAAYWTALARSMYLVSDVDLDPRLVKRPGQIVVRAQRGTPLDHIGLDLREHPATARDTDFAALLRDADQWDYCLSGNRHATLVQERVFPSRYTTLEYGSPRNDRLQRAGEADVARLRDCLGIPEGAVALLYAPADRGYRRAQRPMLDLDRVARRLGPRFVVLARTRYAPPVPAWRHPRVIDVSGHPHVASLCLAADALLTDHSPLMFDYAGLDRPIVIETGDWEAYEAVHGLYVDVREFPPGAVANGEDELIDVFATGHWHDARSARLRATFRERFCPYDDGRAAERVVRRVLGGTAALPSVVPLAERRPAPAAEPATTPLTSVSARWCTP
ncbi:bifunctional glycosyltransferase/CDP-glycerol:glycerophosphate glycerophosphotransferase [Streptomyces cavernae]|uniref:bifunctional glycosyltransferase/CDP-glycerol:glycerophosphate glycerophosphotransferase n=1 Tax=Streptomyces cavernae TaxID=2259034 RepID=UPI000FEB8CF6|nr:bifunctional glycosyltransferase/CDP-glycerol:glycerophosphate glycerophosphotransferase [Streptomyces cavernae]